MDGWIGFVFASVFGNNMKTGMGMGRGSSFHL